MANNNNMLQLCRLCLVKDDVNIPIFEDQGDIRQIFLKISSCLPVKVAREDRLPKKICDGCSYKLDMLYEFWNTSANAEKQLLSWLGEAGVPSKMADGALTAVAQQMKPAEAFVKEETLELPDGHADDDDKEYLFAQQKVEESASAGPSATVTSNEDEEPPPKRARRTAAVKAAIAMDQESDDDDDSGEPLTKIEDESEDSDGEDHVPAFVDVPSTSADDQPGPSGVGKDGVEAPSAAGFQCDQCNFFFRKLSNLLRHQKNTHGERPYECEICSKRYRSPNDVRVHKLQVHFRLNSVKCGFCDKIFNDKRYLIKHITSEHFNEKLLCEHCDASFKTEKALSNHVDATHLGITYPCEHCHKVYTNLQYYRNHLKSHSPGYQKQIFQCDMCPRRYRYKHGLTRHMKEHFGTADSFVCEICGKRFNNSTDLRDHILGHSQERPFQCDMCDKAFKKMVNLNHHRRLHTEQRYAFVCYICGKGLSSNNSLQVHMRVHTGEAPFQCELCPKKCKSKFGLEVHQQVHSDETPFECDICSKKCKSKQRLERHMQVHTDERPYACDVCLKEFKNRHNMKRHRLTHSNEKPHVCEFCDRAFSQHTNLVVHRAIHTGERPYECGICSKKFVTKYLLNKHKCKI